jgi:hypothetical protein
MSHNNKQKRCRSVTPDPHKRVIERLLRYSDKKKEYDDMYDNIEYKLEKATKRRNIFLNKQINKASNIVALIIKSGAAVLIPKGLMQMSTLA